MADIAKHLLVAVQCEGGYAAEVDHTSVKVSPNIQQELDRAGGLHPQIAINLTAAPVIEFTIRDIKLVDGPTLVTVAKPLVLSFRALTDTFGMGTGWISLTITSGMIEPVTLSGSRGKLATLAVRVHLLSSDGDTSPITVGTTSAVPVAPTDFFTLGGVSIGSALAGMTDFSLSFGYQAVPNPGENGKPYPTAVFFTGQAASMTATVEQLAVATQARLMQGTVETTVTAAFRKLNQAAIPVDSGGYLVTALKGAVTLGLGSERPATVKLDVALLANDAAGTDYLQFSNVA